MGLRCPFATGTPYGSRPQPRTAADGASGRRGLDSKTGETMRTRVLPFLWACAVAAQVTTHPVPAPTAPEAILFAFDDQSIPFRHNLYLTMHRPEKREAPVLRRGDKGTPDEFGACFYGSILHLDGKYRMWYIAYDADAIAALNQRSIRSWRLAYAESTDGISWKKPNLGLVE